MATVDELLVRIDASTEQLRREIGRADRSVEGFRRQVDRETRRIDQSFDRLGRGVSTFRAALAGIGFGVFVREVFQTATALDRINRRFQATMGTAEAAGAEYQFVATQADRLGLELISTADAYSKFTAAARGTALEGRAARDIFVAVAEASTVMGLSAEETEGALRALEQMVSKGNVQAEELRGQLGERLPGAFQMAANAMGVTTGELDKMLQRGEVTAADLLPRLARELHETFGPDVERAARSTTAQINRFQNAITDLKGEFARSGFVEGFLSAMDDLRDVMTDPAFRQAMFDLGQMVGQLAAFLGAHARELALLASIMAGARTGQALGGIAGSRGRIIGGVGGAILGGVLADRALGVVGGGGSTAPAVSPEIAAARERSDEITRAIGDLVSELHQVNEDLRPLQTGLDEGGGGGGMQAGIVDALVRRRIELSRQIRALMDEARSLPTMPPAAAPASPAAPAVPSDPLADATPPISFGQPARSRADQIDEANNALSEFLRGLEHERQLAGLTTRERAIQEAQMRAQRIALEDGNSLTLEQLDAIRAIVGATIDLEEAQRAANDALAEGEAFATELGDTLADAIGRAATEFENFGDIARSVLADIQRLIVQTFIVGPIGNVLQGLAGDLFGGLLGGFGGKRAAGGPVTSGAAYLVGERGPELFVPKTDGFVMSNAATMAAASGGGGGTVVINNSYRFDGQSGPTRAELVAVLEQNRQATLAELQDRMSRGGSFARAVRGR